MRPSNFARRFSSVTDNKRSGLSSECLLKRLHLYNEDFSDRVNIEYCDRECVVYELHLWRKDGKLPVSPQEESEI